MTTFDFFFPFLLLGCSVFFFNFFNFLFYISFGELGTKKKKKLYRLTGVGPMNSVKILSDEIKSDVAKWVWKNEWWVMSYKWWMMKIEWQKSSDHFLLAKQALRYQLQPIKKILTKLNHLIIINGQWWFYVAGVKYTKSSSSSFHIHP